MYKLLDGIRVLDLSNTVLGPLVGQILGDLGADVVKIEPLEGDVFRYVAPARSRGMGANFMNVNRNKRSIALDLKTESGIEVFLKLARTADVLFTNMRPAAIERLGIGYDVLKEQNKSLIFCTGVGFGEDGPYANYPAYDDIIQGMSGIAHLSRGPTGEPRFVPTILADKITALYNVYGILAALYSRTKTNEGVQVAAPMFECICSFVLAEHLSGRTFEPPIGDTGYSRLTSPYRKPYKTADGYLSVMPYTTKHWQDFLRFVGRNDLANEERVVNPQMRSQHIESLYQIVAQEVEKQSSEHWVAALDKLGIPHGRINTLNELLDDRHLNACSFFQTVDHPSEGKLTTVRQPVTFKDVPTSADVPAPRLGQHNTEVLAELGYSVDQIAKLEESGVLRVSARQ